MLYWKRNKQSYRKNEKYITKKILKLNEVYEREDYLGQLFDTNIVKDVFKKIITYSWTINNK